MKETYLESKNYNSKNALYLRFTYEPELDLQRNISRWYEGNPNCVEDGKAWKYDEVKQMHYLEHDGLCGHLLEASTLEEAIKEVLERGCWYCNANETDFAIFECDEATMHGRVKEDTPEGHTFRAMKVLYTREY